MGNCSLDGVSWKVSETTEKVETINAHLLEDLRIRDAWRGRSNQFEGRYETLLKRYNELQKQHEKLVKVNSELSQALTKMPVKKDDRMNRQ
mgnify:CR=1 FL=1